MSEKCFILPRSPNITRLNKLGDLIYSWDVLKVFICLPLSQRMGPKAGNSRDKIYNNKAQNK